MLGEFRLDLGALLDEGCLGIGSLLDEGGLGIGKVRLVTLAQQRFAFAGGVRCASALGSELCLKLDTQPGFAFQGGDEGSTSFLLDSSVEGVESGFGGVELGLGSGALVNEDGAYLSEVRDQFRDADC